MGKFNPDDYRIVPAKGGKFDPEQFRILEENKPSLGVSAVRQGLQGATAGFSDEIAGGVEAAGRVVGINGLGGPMKNISANESGPTFSKEELSKAYEAGRNQERKSLEKDYESNPKTSLAANIIGGVASPVNKVTKGMSIVKSGATLGGVYGLGGSESDSLGGVALDTVAGVATGAAVGKGLDKLGKMIAPASKAIVDKISPASPRLNKDEIFAAADRLGVKVTPGMMDDTGFVERLESTLAKSPSFFGQNVAKRQRAVTDALTNAVEGTTKDATNLSTYQVGEKFKSGVTAKVGERLDPIKAVFDDVSQSTKFIPVSDRSKNAIVNNIQKNDTYALTGGAGKPGQYVEMIGRLENADQVKTAMTLLNADIKASMGAEKQVLIAIKNKLGALEENSITRAAIQQAREGGMRTSTGKMIGKEIVGDLRDARTGYRNLSTDLGALAENARVKTNKGPSAFIDSVESIPSERIQDKFFNVENNRALSNLKEKFPEQFDLLRAGKLKEISESSVDNSLNGQGRISTQKFMNEVRALTSEAKELLFGASKSTIDDISTIQKIIPRNFNPSGTASSLGWQDTITQNVKDVPNYIQYKAATSNLGEKLINGAKNIDPNSINNIRDVSASGAKQLAKPAARITATEFATKPQLKGFEKWAADGADKVIDHDSSLSREDLEKIKESKKGKELLIKASDLKPKTKAMDKIVAEIRSMNGDE